MKSIKDTLTLVNNIITEIKRDIKIEIALVGGYAVIAHGIGRTTMDVDFLVYSQDFKGNSSRLVEVFRNAVPGHFEMKLVEGSKRIDDPFPYDILFLTDGNREYPKMDFILPRYKWELEGIRMAKPLVDFPFPVISLPHLISMKLRAGGPRDDFDVAELYKLLSGDEKKKTLQLANQIRRDKKLSLLIDARRTQADEPEDNDQLI